MIEASSGHPHSKAKPALLKEWIRAMPGDVHPVHLLARQMPGPMHRPVVYGSLVRCCYCIDRLCEFGVCFACKEKLLAIQREPPADFLRVRWFRGQELRKQNAM